MRIAHLRLCLTAIVLLTFSGAFGQGYAESALLFSRNQPSGSARILGLGGSQTALGGDYSSGLSNPAGLGMFNRSEFTFSLGLADAGTSADYRGTHTDDHRSVFNIPGLSYVWHMPSRNEDYRGSFGISLSRVNDFNHQTLYRGNNEDNSIIDYFIDQSNGETTDQFLEPEFSNYNTPAALAYFNYLIGPKSILDPPGAEDEYFTDATYPYQQEEIQIKGASNQWSFSYGGNVRDKFFFGAGVGITSLNYRSRKIFTEDFSGEDVVLQNLQLVENLNIQGTGFNATVGAIARPVNFLQIGISYTTPTYYGLTETYDASMSSRWDSFDYYGDGKKILTDNSDNPEKTDLTTSDYNLTVPMRLRAGVAFISEYGFLTADVEMTNPSRAKYGTKDANLSFIAENEDIKGAYQPVINYQIGAEFRHDIFRVRAGYGVQANTFRESMNADNTISSVSGGLGIRLKTFYIDLALIHAASKAFQYQPYTFSDGSGPVADLKNKSTRGVITVGFSL